MVQYETDFFLDNLKQFNIFPDEKAIKRFLRYYELLSEWNKVMNLTAIIDYKDVMIKHFTDSLSLALACDLSGDLSLIDVGTGAGFPGIPLKIAFPNLKVTLIDSLRKRISFLDTVIEELELGDIEAIHGRAEDLARPDKLREGYDICVSRAVANLSVLSEYCLPYVKVGGLFVSYKSEKAAEEIKAAGGAFKKLGGKLERQVEFSLPGSDFYRNLILIRKKTKTNPMYPRKAGLPVKQPL